MVVSWILMYMMVNWILFLQGRTFAYDHRLQRLKAVYQACYGDDDDDADTSTKKEEDAREVDLMLRDLHSTCCGKFGCDGCRAKSNLALLYFVRRLPVNIAAYNAAG